MTESHAIEYSYYHYTRSVLQLDICFNLHLPQNNFSAVLQFQKKIIEWFKKKNREKKKKKKKKKKEKKKKKRIVVRRAKTGRRSGNRYRP